MIKSTFTPFCILLVILLYYYYCIMTTTNRMNNDGFSNDSNVTSQVSVGNECFNLTNAKPQCQYHIRDYFTELVRPFSFFGIVVLLHRNFFTFMYHLQMYLKFIYHTRSPFHTEKVHGLNALQMGCLCNIFTWQTCNWEKQSG